MSTSGQKRKLKDTDIPITDRDTPSVKQQKLTNTNERLQTTNDTLNKEIQTETKQETKEETPNDETIQKIKSQLEYYFGDSNLPLDTHILQTSKQTINAGYYPVSGLLNFKILQTLTNNVSHLIHAIESSDKLQLNENKTGVRRHPSLPDPPTKEDIYNRTIFAKGFHPRTQLNELNSFWKTQTEKTENILSVRNIKDQFSVGIAENNKPKMVKRFVGNCCIEFDTKELAQQFAKMTFEHNGRIIRCGMYQTYCTDEIEWKIKPKYAVFQSNRIIFVRDIPPYTTWNDIKTWICNGLYGKCKKKESINRVVYVYKEMNEGCAYVRFSESSDVKQCVQLINKKALMGLNPKIIILNDEKAKQIWNKVSEIVGNKNKEVEIIVKDKCKVNNDNRNKRNVKDKEENDEQDIDICDNESVSDKCKKHKLENADSTQPIKKQKIS